MDLSLFNIKRGGKKNNSTQQYTRSKVNSEIVSRGKKEMGQRRQRSFLDEFSVSLAAEVREQPHACQSRMEPPSVLVQWERFCYYVWTCQCGITGWRVSTIDSCFMAAASPDPGGGGWGYASGLQHHCEQGFRSTGFSSEPKVAFDSQKIMTKGTFWFGVFASFVL